MRLAVKRPDLLLAADFLGRIKSQRQGYKNKGWEIAYLLHPLLSLATLVCGYLATFADLQSIVLAADVTVVTPSGDLKPSPSNTAIDLTGRPSVDDIKGGKISREAANLLGNFTHDLNSSQAASFLYTTATGNDDNALGGNPSGFAFTRNETQSITNLRNLSVSQGQNLSLMGSTVESTMNLSPLGEELTAIAVPGENLLRLKQLGNVLSLEIKPTSDLGLYGGSSNPMQNWTVLNTSLPTLLTGGGQGHATALKANSDGSVQLTGSGISVANGNVAAKKLTAPTATLLASRTSRDMTINTSVGKPSQTGAVILNAVDSQNIHVSAKIGGEAGTSLDGTSHNPQTGTVSTQSNISLNSSVNLTGNIQLKTGTAEKFNDSTLDANTNDIRIQKATGLGILLINTDRNASSGSVTDSSFMGIGGSADMNATSMFQEAGTFLNQTSMLAGIATDGVDDTHTLPLRNGSRARLIPFPERDSSTKSGIDARSTETRSASSASSYTMLAPMHFTVGEPMPEAIATGLSHTILPSRSFAGSYTQDNISLLTSFSMSPSTATLFNFTFQDTPNNR